MKLIERIAKPVVTPRTAPFASLRAPHILQGTSTSKIKMSAHRLTLATLVAVCGLFTPLLFATTAFATPPETPITGEATHIQDTTAELEGAGWPHSEPPNGSRWSFEYNEGTKCTGGDKTSMEGSENLVIPGSIYYEEIAGLKPGATYMFCMLSENETKEVTVGAPKSFKTETAQRIGSVGYESGGINSVSGLAVDQATGDVYVGDSVTNRVDVFDSSGNFVMAWGWDVNAARPANELQICTNTCKLGSPGGGMGEFGGQSAQMSVAVDNELGSTSYGDVYIVDWANHRVQKFSPSGEFLAMFGGEVNVAKDDTPGATASEKDLCVAGEVCQQGNSGTADGEFDWAYDGGEDIAVGPGGSVYVGDRARVQVFEPSGAWLDNISLESLSTTDQVTALAVNSVGDVFVNDGNLDESENRDSYAGVPGVREFEPDGVEVATQFDAGSTTIMGVAVDASGDVLVGDGSGGYHVSAYSPAGNRLANFGANIILDNQDATMAIAQDGALYVGNYYEYFVTQNETQENPGLNGGRTLNVTALPVPTTGPPTIEADGVRAVAGPRRMAALDAGFDAGGFVAKYHFEYVSEADFRANGYTEASSTPEVTVAATLEEQSAHVALTGLVPGETYHYRLVVSNSKGTSESSDQSFEELPSASVRGPWVTDVAATSVTFGAEVDPLGTSTEYKLEYGKSTDYGEAVTGDLGAGEDYVSIGSHRQELSPNTVYHYRLVTYSEFGTIEGLDQTFTTQSVSAGEFTLPDRRVWELVSPPNKKGALIEPFEDIPTQAAADGSGISYSSVESVGEGTLGKGAVYSQILSQRGPDGWKTQDISIPHALADEKEEATQMSNIFIKSNYWVFSPNLSQAVVEPTGVTPALSPDASERTLYLGDDETGTYVPLVTSANVPTGVKFGGEEGGPSNPELHFLTATPDLSHVILESPFPLTSESTSPPAGECRLTDEGFCENPAWNLYEWSADGRLQLVDVLPDKEPLQLFTPYTENGAFGSASLGVKSLMVAHSVSSNGRWVVWQTGPMLDSEEAHLYVRDMVGEKTYQLGGSRPLFQTMSNDGSKVLFMEFGELYEFDTSTGVQSDLTASHGAGESNAGVQDQVVGENEDGSTVYFVAKGVLASGAVAGEDNLYVMREGADGWNTSYIATLSSEDKPDWIGNEALAGRGGRIAQLGNITSRVSPDGKYLAFMSDRPLTSYDNVDALSGQRDEEVYLYDAQTARLACASCNPTGARPVGLFNENGTGGGPLVDKAAIWRNHWIAGSLPGWSGPASFGEVSQYQPRFLSNEGRLFFDSPDALVAQDTDGLEDVYEFEPVGMGDCEDASGTFSERAGGCVSLISSGTSSDESAFLDASETGNDVFFDTASKLVAADYDNSFDVYDAHACSAEVPCAAEPVSPPACTTEASCRPAPSPQPEIFGPAPSATFSGTGDVSGEAVIPVKSTKGATKPKSKTKKKKKHKKDAPKKHKAKKARRATRVSVGKASERGVA